MKIFNKKFFVHITLTSLLVSTLFSSCTNIGKTPTRTIASIPTIEEFQQFNQERLKQVLEQEHIVKDQRTISENFSKYMIQAYGESNAAKVDLAEQGQRYLRANGVKLIHNVFEELKGRTGKYKITDAPQWTLKEEIKYLNATLDNEEVLANNETIDKFLSAVKVLDINDSSINHLVPEGNEDLIPLMRKLQTSENSTELYLNVANTFEDKLSPYFNRIQNLGQELERNGDITFGNPDAEKFVKGFLNFYYQNVDPAVLKDIISDLARLGEEPTQDEMIAVMFKNSGPGLGKTLQQLGKDPNMGKAMADMMEVLEDDGKVVPYHLVENIVAEDGGFEFVSIKEDPLGVGTVAQVHKAEIKYRNKPTTVALRFLKPDIDKRAKDDIRILKSFVQKLAEDGEVTREFLIPIKKMVESIESFLYSELDIQETIKRQNKAKRVYSKAMKIDVDGKDFDVEITVPRIYKAKRGKKSNLHVQEFLNLGEKYSDIQDPKKRKAISRSIVKVWFEEALLNSGFFHSDLHQGNFSLLLDDNNSDGKMKLALFDFGMSDTLKAKTKRSFLLISVGAKYQSANLLSRGILSIHDNPNNKKVKKLASTIEKIMKTETLDSQEWIIWAMKNGHLESEQLGTLARGGTLVSQLPKLVDDWDYTEEMVEDMLKDRMQGEYFSFDYDFPVTRTDVLRMGGARISSSCRKAMSFFFK